MNAQQTFFKETRVTLLMLATLLLPAVTAAEETGDAEEASADAEASADEALLADSNGNDDTEVKDPAEAPASEPVESDDDGGDPATENGEKASGGDADADDVTENETKGIADEAEKFFSSIGIWRLKGEAFSSKKTLGIPGGSLSQISHGLQWPYMKRSGIGVSGYIWIDTGYEKIDRSDDPNQKDTKYLLQEGRFLLRITPTYTRGRWFIQGQAELVANKDQSSTQPAVVDADDVWAKVGMWNLFDLQVGRFEAWELYHFGLGMDINTLERRGAWESGTVTTSVPDIYGVTFAYYRPSGVGNVAAHFFPTDFFRFELLGQVGNQGSLNTGAFRGAGILDFGVVKIKGGGEYVKRKSTNEGTDEQDDRGAGGTVQVVLNPYVEFGGSGAWAITDWIDNRGNVNQKASYATWSVGGFANVRIIEDLLFGVGANYTFLKDTHEDENGDVGEFAHLQTFGALQYMLFKRLLIKAVFAWAKGDVNASFSDEGIHSNLMMSGRLRLQYNF